MMKQILTIAALGIITTLSYSQHLQVDPEDPFIWLEAVEGEKAKLWVETQNELSENFITTNPNFQSIYERILEVLSSSESLTEPQLAGDYIYDLKKDNKYKLGLWRRISTTDFALNRMNWEKVLDIDSLSASENKRYYFEGVFWLEPENYRCIIRLSDEGRGEDELREFDVQRKVFIKDGYNIPESNSYFNWIDINHAYVTTTYGDSQVTQFGLPRKIKLWERGTTLNDARTVFEVDSMDLGIYSNVIQNPERRYEIIARVISRSNVETYLNIENELKRLEIPQDCWLTTIFKNQVVIPLGRDWQVNGKIYEKGSLVSFDVDEFLSGKREITTLLTKEDRLSIINITCTKDLLLVNCMRDIQNELIAFKYDNNKWIQLKVNTPDFGSITNIFFSRHSDNYFFTYSNLLIPNTLFYSNGLEIKKVKSLPEYFDGDQFEVRKRVTISKDGTKIPYFMVYRKGTKFDGSNPTLLYGYGGFGISLIPAYDGKLGPWLERGGIYVLAIIRGGGEFGPSWHQAAVKEKRQNAFDDFLSVANDLINTNVTSPEHLGIMGASNGGLLVGVAFTQHPELFNAVVCASPLLDMKRYINPLGGRFFIDEFGDPEDPGEWEYIKEYSPYHNLSPDKVYPEVLFTASMYDKNVHPAHARKMAAKMKEMGHIVHYYEETEGGHLAEITHERTAYIAAIWYTFLYMKTK